MNPLLVVDIQPAYAQGFVPAMVANVLREMEARVDHAPVLVMSVNEEFSGDTPETIQEFWLEHGMSEELLERVRFVEKTYGFFRGWMDNGVSDDEIVEVSRYLTQQRKWDSRDLDEELLAELAPDGAELCDPLIRPDELEPLKLAPHWDVCGGGANECLKEVELWCASQAIATERLDHLVYGH